jgi:hypothetical protein
VQYFAATRTKATAKVVILLTNCWSRKRQKSFVDMFNCCLTMPVIRRYLLFCESTSPRQRKEASSGSKFVEALEKFVTISVIAQCHMSKRTLRVIPILANYFCEPGLEVLRGSRRPNLIPAVTPLSLRFGSSSLPLS